MSDDKLHTAAEVKAWAEREAARLQARADRIREPYPSTAIDVDAEARSLRDLAARIEPPSVDREALGREVHMIRSRRIFGDPGQYTDAGVIAYARETDALVAERLFALGRESAAAEIVSLEAHRADADRLAARLRSALDVIRDLCRMHPHPVEHPAMFASKERAERFLAETDPRSPARVVAERWALKALDVHEGASSGSDREARMCALALGAKDPCGYLRSALGDPTIGAALADEIEAVEREREAVGAT